MDDRLFYCERCRAMARVCRPCDRGQRYCSKPCRDSSRREKQRKAEHRYRRSTGGAGSNRRRQKRHRIRESLVSTKVPSKPEPDLEDRARALGLWGLLASWKDVEAEPWLKTVVEIEENERRRRSLERRMRDARIGRFRLMADFNWKWPKKIDRDLVEEALRLAYGGERIVLHRHGKDLAAIVPVEDLAILEAIEDRDDVRAARERLAEARASGERPVPLAEVKRRLGL